MRILVTGAAGFVGSHVVDRLVADGHDVVALDRRAPGPDRCNPDARWVTGDARDPEAWARHLPGVEAISHQAAMVGLGVDLGDVRRYVDDNDAATAAGLWALHTAGWRGRLVLASSMVVYGEGRYRCPSHGGVTAPPRDPAALDAGRWEPPCPRCGADLSWAPVTEDAPADPRNVYAATKLHQEHLVAAFARETGQAAVALRYHNVYGPRLPLGTPYAGVAALFATRVAAGESPVVFEDGGQARDFVHVHDVARANARALTAERARPGLRAYNVASGHPVTILDVARHVAAGSGAPAPQVVGGYRLGDVRHVVASPARAARELGFRAAVAPADGLATLRDDSVAAPPPPVPASGR
jgi:dTDP-L-rhamnose 4-epimerase